MGLVQWFHSYLPQATLFSIGSFQFHWYGLMLALGVLVGYGLARIIWRRRAWPLAYLDELVIWLVIAGLVGARLLDVFVYEWWYFKAHLVEIFYIWQGGLAWHGGLLAALPVLWWFVKKYKMAIWDVLDSLAPALAVGQAIGRWGNYFNQELFGLPTTLPWGIPIAVANRPAAYVNYTYFHPTFLYESIGLALIAWLLWSMVKKRFWSGQVFAVYLLLAGLLRLALEFIRLDEQDIYLGLRAGIWIALVTILVGFGFWFGRNKKSASMKADD
jgi:phosphatidylglycerol---prolipoprotein diacylglyceryl transferase